MTARASQRGSSPGARSGWLAALVPWALLAGPAPATATEPEVILRLQKEFPTRFDLGMSRLRRAAIDAAPRLAAGSPFDPLVRVWYDPKVGTIEIRFRFEGLAGDALTMERCGEMRKTAIRETFRVGRTFYAQPMSFDERVRRRLGSQFAREPVNGAKEVIALGQRLAELTYLGVALVDGAGGRTITCRARVAVPMGVAPRAPGTTAP